MKAEVVKRDVRGLDLFRLPNEACDLALEQGHAVWMCNQVVAISSPVTVQVSSRSATAYDGKRQCFLGGQHFCWIYQARPGLDMQQ